MAPEFLSHYTFIRLLTMCGICGYIGIDDADLIVRMTDRLTHRGPDDVGHYHDATVHLGHRRLSIIDLAGGHQPMTSRDGSKTIVFNGEIYNYRDIRDRLVAKGHTFETNSDTEVLLRIIETEGPDGLQQLNGMFAFAIYDRHTGDVFIARDRIGIKPLYYLELPGKFLFASEVKALHCYRGWSPTMRAGAIDDYLALRYVPGDRTVFSEVRRLPAGHFLTCRNGQVEVSRYWSPPRYDGPYTQSDGEYQEEFEHLLEASVRRRLISDVSFGAYLSGGLDSSMIVALMSQMVSGPVKTFSVGFDYEHDELTEAAATAKYLGCDHHEIACRASDVALLPKIVYHLDEPMGDGIIIPMFQLSREAKKQVTVILTGEGGDEVLGGYLFHKIMAAGELYRRVLPRVLRNGVVTPMLELVPAGAMNLAFKYPAYLGRRGKRKALDYLRLLEPDRLDDAYRHLISLFDARDTADLYSSDFREQLAVENRGRSGVSTDGRFLNRLLRLQFEHWLPDNMLLRQDKTGMAHAIEGRVPFLDHTLVEFAQRLPPRMKIRRMAGKYVLRRFAEKVLPAEVAHRKKMPFYVPMENYFQQPAFQEMMADLLSDKSIRDRGLFDVSAVARLREAMHRREFLFVKQVFSLMVLELWFRLFQDRSITV